jgi:hypothetical protein
MSEKISKYSGITASLAYDFTKITLSEMTLDVTPSNLLPASFPVVWTDDGRIGTVIAHVIGEFTQKHRLSTLVAACYFQLQKLELEFI